MASSQDSFSKLTALRWRGIRFPLANLHTSFKHDIAQHRKPDRDGARLEATGRGARTFSGKALFRNGIVFETPAYSTLLYPDLYKAFEAACADRSTGDLIHPDLGTFKCKVESFDATLDANMRDGVDVDVVWVEHTEEERVLSSIAPLSDAISTAFNLDSDLAFLRAQFDRLNRKLSAMGNPSFTDALRFVQTAISRASSLQRSTLAQIGRIQAQLSSLRKTASEVNSILVHPLRQNIERLAHSLDGLKQSSGVTKPIGIHTVKADTSVPSLAMILRIPISPFLQLNPWLASQPVVVRGSKVRYYL